MIKEAIVKIVDKQDLTYDEAYAVMNEIMSGDSVVISDSDELKKIVEAYDEDVYNSNYIDIYNRMVSGDDESSADRTTSEKSCSVSLYFRENEKQMAEIWFSVDGYHPAVWKYLSEAGYVS